MWRGGCIIRSVFLKDITKAYRANPDLENLLFDDFFNKAIHKAQSGWRDVVSKGALWGIPTPAFSTALSFYDGYRAKDLPANLLQAQRDYFGAHTFRIKPEFANETYKEGQDIHVNWTGRGGNVSASVSAFSNFDKMTDTDLYTRLTPHKDPALSLSKEALCYCSFASKMAMRWPVNSSNLHNDMIAFTGGWLSGSIDVNVLDISDGVTVR
jgi:hypothetical protein